ncbi:MAG: hypothetical protein IKL62_02090 [Clostridia bacterium]|nr:hypothetical protein [Clostridia bacterium]
MKRFFYAFTCIALVACLFTGCGKKKIEDGASDIESTVSDIASDVESGVSSIESEIMPSSSNVQ